MIKISLLLVLVLVVASGCTEQYQNNAQLRNLYRVLNYETSFKERTLCFELVDYNEMVSAGEFYIMGAGIMSPGAYDCSSSETVLTAISKAGQTASHSSISYTLVRGIRDDEQLIRGMAMISGSSTPPSIKPGDLLYLKSNPVTVALSQK